VPAWRVANVRDGVCSGKGDRNVHINDADESLDQLEIILDNEENI
jgi:hypothetical protein